MHTDNNTLTHRHTQHNMNIQSIGLEKGLRVTSQSEIHTHTVQPTQRPQHTHTLRPVMYGKAGVAAPKSLSGSKETLADKR